MSDTAEWLRLYARKLDDEHAPHNLSIGMREAADQMDQQRETTLQLLGQVGQLSDELERLKNSEARLRAALREIIADCSVCGGTGSLTEYDAITDKYLWRDCRLCEDARAALEEEKQ